MDGPAGSMMGYVLTRTILVAAVLFTFWAAWRGLYVPAAGVGVAVGYFVYLAWRHTATEPTDTDL